MCVRKEFVLTMCSKLHSHFVKQHDYFKNVLTFDPTPGVEGVCKDRKCDCILEHSSFPLL